MRNEPGGCNAYIWRMCASHDVAKQIMAAFFLMRGLNMNPIRKAYCRAFQTCFKLALPILPYRKPKIFKSVCELPGLFDKKKINKVLLVTDKSVRSLGLTEELEMCLKANDIELTIYDGTVANPTTTNVEDARELYLEGRKKDRRRIIFIRIFLLLAIIGFWEVSTAIGLVDSFFTSSPSIVWYASKVLFGF